MNTEPRSYWFPAKRLGWGWGLPVFWQGWFVLAAYLVLTFAGIRHVRGHHDGRGPLIYLAVLTVVLVLVLVIVAKGERQGGN
jgi:hypothetical protein